MKFHNFLLFVGKFSSLSLNSIVTMEATEMIKNNERRSTINYYPYDDTLHFLFLLLKKENN